MTIVLSAGLIREVNVDSLQEVGVRVMSFTITAVVVVLVVGKLGIGTVSNLTSAMPMITVISTVIVAMTMAIRTVPLRPACQIRKL
jgi:hypothetical protein